MKARNSTASLPMAGIVTLSLAAFAAGALIARSAALEALLQPWYLTRASGLVAFALLWASVALGLLQSTGSLRRVTSPAANVDVHGFVALGALYAAVFHAAILHWDQYVPFGWAEILVPFRSDYEPALVGLGGLAFYLALGATVTTYLRPRLGTRLWRLIHLLTLPGFALALIHGWLLGTDAGEPALAYLYRFSALSVAALLLYRIALGVRARARAAGRG